MVKIIYKPLEELENLKKPQTKSSYFSEMLNEHLKQTKGNTANLASAKPESTPVDANKPWNPEDEKLNQGLEELKNIDSDYYKKGVKKKTLAQTYAARNNSNLKDRIQKYKHLIEAKAKKYGLNPNLLAGLITQESNFNPYAVSQCGAMGLGQLMPETARYLGVKDPFNAAQNLDAAAKYLSEQLKTFGGNVNKALAAYNAGPGAVKKYGGIPPYRETRNYVSSINSHFKLIAKLDLFNETKKA